MNSENNPYVQEKAQPPIEDDYYHETRIQHSPERSGTFKINNKKFDLKMFLAIVGVVLAYNILSRR